MPVVDDVMDIVRILDEEGFGVVAGELLATMNRGREVPPTQADRGAEVGEIADVEPRREPIPDGEQLGEALAFVRASLVEPVRRLAKAERIGGGLLMRGLLRDESRGCPPDTGGWKRAEAVRLVPVDAVGVPVPGATREEAPGSARSAERLDAVLRRIATERA